MQPTNCSPHWTPPRVSCTWVKPAARSRLSDTVGFIRDLPHGLVEAFPGHAPRSHRGGFVAACGGRGQPRFSGANGRSAQSFGKKLVRTTYRNCWFSTKLMHCHSERISPLHHAGPLTSWNGLPVPRVFISAQKPALKAWPCCAAHLVRYRQGRTATLGPSPFESDPPVALTREYTGGSALKRASKFGTMLYSSYRQRTIHHEFSSASLSMVLASRKDKRHVQSERPALGPRR